MSQFPDTATLHTALEIAARAPSVRNSQPWHWQVDPGGLHLDADWSRSAGETLADRRDVLLSCGAVLDHCVLTLATAGWGAAIRRLPAGRRPGHLATVELISAPPTAAATELAAAIPQRRADRRGYADSRLIPATLEMLLIRAARTGVQMSVVPKARWSRSVDGEVRLHYGAAARRDGPGTGDGVLLVLATESDDDAMRLRAGEAMSHLLLSATALGLASCPLTDPLRDDRDRMALACDLYDGAGYPQALIRLGPLPPGATPLPVGTRRTVAETTTFSG